ncbi:predicted protein [Postia placenta Mad-698-R]|nr:predicted protein [Postia placenta Mad-698-R]
MADDVFDCSQLEHTFNTQEQVDVSHDNPENDGSKASFFYCCSPSPLPPIISSSSPPNKEVNTALSTIELKVQITLSLLDGDARTWATLIFAQLVAFQVRVQGVITLFADARAFITAFKNCFGNFDDAAAAQVELSKLCADKSMHEKRTAEEFSTLFKGPVDHSGYGHLELHDKYLSGIPFCMYRKIKLEMFATWTATDKRATEVEQQLNISQAH